MAELINEKDTLNDGRKKLNEGIKTSERAENKSVEALLKAIESMNLSDRTQKELTEAILAGDSSPLGGQLSVGADGTVYQGPQERLIAEQEKTSSQLAENEKSLNLKKANAQVPLGIPTYYQYDNHAVHPYVFYDTTKKYGYEYIMAFTPYSESRDRFENPSIVVSEDGYNWYVPIGLANPLVITDKPNIAYYSDPFLIDNGTELEIWYRHTDKDLHGANSKLYRQKTVDCINWSAQELMLDVGEVDGSYIAPCMSIENGTRKLWYRNDHSQYALITSTDLINWSTSTVCNFDFGDYADEEFVNWHNEIKLIDDKYICTAAAINNKDEYKLFLFDSADGINFNLIKLLIEPSISGFDSFRIYKSSIIKYGIWYYIYYSAFAKDNSNHIGLTRASEATMNFTGMTQADKEYYRQKETELQKIYGANRKSPVGFPNGIEISGEGKSHVVNVGRAGYNTQAVKPDTMTIRNDSNTKPGYAEVAGIYLNTDDNDAITGIHRLENAVYIDPTSKRLIVYKGKAKNEYPRMINMRVVANGGNGTPYIYQGSDFIESVVSDVHGLKINLKNMPSGVTPFLSFSLASGDGIRDTANTLFEYLYTREKTYLSCTIGIKTTPEAGHKTFAQASSGAIDICILF